MHVSRPDVVIGQFSDEGGLSRCEEEEAASSPSDPSGPADAVNVLGCCWWSIVLQKTKVVIDQHLLLHSDLHQPEFIKHTCTHL